MFGDKFSIIFIFFGLFCNIVGRNAEASRKIVNVDEKNFGNFDVLNVKVNKQDGKTESKKIVIVNIDNLNLTVDSTRGGVWIYLKNVTSPESKKKINILINDIVVVLDTRNYVTLSIKSTKSINNNNNNNNNQIIMNGNDLIINFNNGNVFVSSNDINDIDINFHWDSAAFSTTIGENLEIIF
ncbi:Protein of unknown function [Cotesia congregata]|uniref:Uncharacterized protein n=1 Tax=Cotesia congregata TaxID=51543 RepID=A0A8J2HKU0_COTCN|nr:Protein of unknown function [Cotesia congregata]